MRRWNSRHRRSDRQVAWPTRGRYRIRRQTMRPAHTADNAQYQLIEFFDEILGGLLQSKHFDALIANQLDDGLAGRPAPYTH
mgnify:CR=1 FL=1